LLSGVSWTIQERERVKREESFFGLVERRGGIRKNLEMKERRIDFGEGQVRGRRKQERITIIERRGERERGVRERVEREEKRRERREREGMMMMREMVCSQNLLRWKGRKGATEIRSGDLLELKGEPFLVASTFLSRKGKTNAFVQLEMKHLFRKSKSNARLKTDEVVTFYEVEATPCVLQEFKEIVKGKKKQHLLVLELQEDIGTIDVNLSELGLDHVVPFLSEGLELTVMMVEEKPFEIKFPDVECEISPDVMGWDKGSKTGQRLTLLTNGQSVKAPHHVKAGDIVTVRLPSLKVM